MNVAVMPRIGDSSSTGEPPAPAAIEARDDAKAGTRREGRFGDLLGEALAPARHGRPERQGEGDRDSNDRAARDDDARARATHAPDLVAPVLSHGAAPGKAVAGHAPEKHRDGTERDGAGGIAVPPPRAAARSRIHPPHATPADGVARLRPNGPKAPALEADPRSGPSTPAPRKLPASSAPTHEHPTESGQSAEVKRVVEASNPLPAHADAVPLALTGEGRASRAAAGPLPPTPASAPLPAPPPGYDVGGAVLRSAAHLKIDAGALGAIELHLRIRDNALHLRVGGDAVRFIEARAGELSHALASEGMKLAPIELPPGEGSGLQGGNSSQGGEQRRDAWNEASERRADPPRAAATVVPPDTSAPTVSVARGRIDVKA